MYDRMSGGDAPSLKILYRADGGQAVGSGHILRAQRVLDRLRCLASVDATLVVNDDPDVAETLSGAGLRTATVGGVMGDGGKPLFEPDYLAAAVDLPTFDAVIVDMLDTPIGALERIRRNGPVVISFDDRGAGRVGADGLINVLIREPYPERLPPEIRLYEGFAYATLQDDYREPMPLPRTFSIGSGRVVVSVGGVDAARLIVKIARGLKRAKQVRIVEFVFGQAFRHVEDLRASLSGAPWESRLSRGLPSLRDAFLVADVAIVAGGMTMHEACCTGTPALAVCQPIDHQHELAVQFEAAGAMRNLGLGSAVSESAIGAAVDDLLSDPDTMIAMSAAGRTLVDGEGSTRTARAILDIIAAREQKG
ncbi:MAG: hypothetical protein HUU17_02860 [Chthonomonadales bacterium]|nr:hypothetical protein [Chthonomonadales bacterium]